MRIRFVKQLLALGSLQVAFGMLAIYFNDVNRGWSIHYSVSQTAMSGKGLWIGVAFIVTGLFGLFGGIRKSMSSVIAFNILSIISASLTVPLLIFSAISAHKEFVDYYNGLGGRSRHAPYDDSAIPQNQLIIAVMDTLMAVVAVLEAITAICSSVICRINGACCPSVSDGNLTEMHSSS